jgi:hypothetical protein
MSVPKNRFGYNEYAPRKDDETYERPKTSFVNEKTIAALQEIDGIETWAQFVEICEKQKIKRGDLKSDAEFKEWWRNFGHHSS